jgi:hypothetical protein
MSAFALRTLLAAILVATITVKVRAAVVPLIDVPAAISRTLAKYGFSPDSNTSTRWLMSFSHPGCRLPLEIETVTLYLGQSTTADAEPRADYIRGFVYMDRQWPTPDRFAMRKEWLKHRILALGGLSPYVPMPIALQIAAPADCPAVGAIAWSGIWADEADGKVGSGISAPESSN